MVKEKPLSGGMSAASGAQRAMRGCAWRLVMNITIIAAHRLKNVNDY
jgi:hypothetical protein